MTVTATCVISNGLLLRGSRATDGGIARNCHAILFPFLLHKHKKRGTIQLGPPVEGWQLNDAGRLHHTGPNLACICMPMVHGAQQPLFQRYARRAASAPTAAGGSSNSLIRLMPARRVPPVAIRSSICGACIQRKQW